MSFKNILVTENSGSQVYVNLSFKDILVTENSGIPLLFLSTIKFMSTSVLCWMDVLVTENSELSLC